jgi:hypothetical protein
MMKLLVKMQLTEHKVMKKCTTEVDRVLMHLSATRGKLVPP